MAAHDLKGGTARSLPRPLRPPFDPHVMSGPSPATTSDFLNALHALAEHEARRPECPCGTPEQDLAWAQELERWERRHQELLVAAGKAPATVSAATLSTQPVTPEVPMRKQAPRVAEERLDDLLARLSNATKEAQAAPNETIYKARKNLVYVTRSQIMGLAKSEGIELPALPPIPANPFKVKGRKPKADSTGTAPRPPMPLRPPVAGAPGEAAEGEAASIEVIAARLRYLREGIWDLLPELQRMPPEQLGQLGGDAGPLRLGAATAERLIKEAQAQRARMAG